MGSKKIRDDGEKKFYSIATLRQKNISNKEIYIYISKWDFDEIYIGEVVGKRIFDAYFFYRLTSTLKSALKIDNIFFF